MGKAGSVPGVELGAGSEIQTAPSREGEVLLDLLVCCDFWRVTVDWVVRFFALLFASKCPGALPEVSS